MMRTKRRTGTERGTIFLEGTVMVTSYFIEAGERNATSYFEKATILTTALDCIKCINDSINSWPLSRFRTTQSL